ncbi:protein-tyrosine phosphatase-like protein [Mycena vitilis]|nr:protein-tyrosine phosphatase-like protein [Mycena vitilis]
MGKREKANQSAASLVFPPSIYLGPCSAASSNSFLAAKSITHVLSIGASPKENIDGVVYHRVSLTDSPSSSISAVCDSACAIIDAALKHKNETGRIFIHCSAGISRSPTVVAAYLMKRRGMTLNEALGQIINARPQVSPNPGFLRQLKELEMDLFGSMSLDIDEFPKREKDRLALFKESADTDGSSAVADFLVKAGVGFSAGVVLSVVLFKRRTWPISLSTGFGAGIAYADCDRSFNPARIPGTRIISQLPQAPQAPAEGK